MGSYTGMDKPALQDALKQRGLPVTGTNAELVARLEQSDDPLNSGGDGSSDNGPVHADQAKLTENSQVDRTPGPAPTVYSALPDEPPPSEYEATYPCQTELSTGMHHSFIERTYADAVAAGHTPRGGANGANGAHRTGFRVVDGVEHAVYSIAIHPPAK